MHFVRPEPQPGPWPEVILTEVANAVLTRVERGGFRTPGNGRFIRGAVYDEDRKLVQHSQRYAPNGHPWIAADNDRIRSGQAQAERLPGRWLYGGHWAQHFGHFVIDSLTTLWPVAPDVDGLVFHKYLRRPAQVEPYQRRALECLGLAHLPIRVVDRLPLQADRLLVPSRTVVPNAFVAEQAVDVWRRVAKAVGTSPAGASRRVYLSRTRFNAALRQSGTTRGPRTSASRDAGLDAVFAGHDFEVVHPEELSFDDQVRLLSGVETVAGLSGTALHMSVFAPASASVIEIGDDRSPEHPSPMQLAIEAASARPHGFVPHSMALDDVGRALVGL